MPRSKAQSPSEDSLEGHEARTRVVKACQRCRLKKCKCDGTSPCSRCKSDDAICAYGKHKKSDKIIFREGYVQMLERQHTQLIAGLQEFYRRIHTHESFPALEPGHHGQPFTHDILKALGVLQSDEWDDNDNNNNNGETFDTPLSSHNFDFHQLTSQDYASLYTNSHTASPTTQTTFSPMSSTHPTFPHDTIIAKRRTKFPSNNIISTNETLLMPPPLPNTNIPSSYHSEPFTNSPFQMPQHLTAFSNDNEDNGFSHVDWMNVAVDGLFGSNQIPQLQIAT